MKEAVRKVIDTLTQEDFHGAFQKLLERYNKCIAAGGDYFEYWGFQMEFKPGRFVCVCGAGRVVEYTDCISTPLNECPRLQ